jgi:Tfp pilus assembly protein PilV
MKQPSGPAGTEGFALVEVMLALAVLGGVVFVMATTLMTSGSVERFNQQRSQVTQLLASQLEKDATAAATATWTSSGPSGLPSSTTASVAGTTVTITVSGGWCEEAAAGRWVAYSGYRAASPPAPPAPGQIDTSTEVIGPSRAWKEQATARWGHGQTMRIATLLPTPWDQPVQPASTGTCPS